MRTVLAAAFALAACGCATMKPRVLDAGGLPQLGPYSQAVAANGLVFFSGIIAFDPATKTFAPADIDAQTHQVFKNLMTVLRANAMSLPDVVKTTVFLKDAADMKRMNAVYSNYFPVDPPARTAVPGADWGRPDILIEIDAIAVQRRP